jgi:PAT family beta-lactamase induction signal transducer AmpG
VGVPLVDRLPIPLLTRLLGRRRSWLLLAQCTIVALVGMALTDPRQALTPVVWCAGRGLWSATQDIALDAYRIESAADKRAALAPPTRRVTASP